MFPGLFPDDTSERRVVKAIFGATRWNRYASNWSVVLRALRQLWEVGKVSEFQTPFYEPFEKPLKS